MYPVVVSDLDGTLLNQHHELSDRTRRVIRRLSGEGVKFVFATGRHYQDVEQLRAQLGIDMYLITSNGARVYNPGGELIIQHDIQPDLLSPLLALRKPFADCVATNVFQGEQWLVEQEHKELLDFHKDTGFCYQLADLDALTPKAIQKVFFVARSQKNLLPLSDQAEALFGDRLAMTYSLPECFEVMAPSVSKGSALEEVLRLKGYGFEDAIAFGDGMNDLQMLSSVGKGVLMGNADPSLVSHLPEYEQIGFCHDDAVAHYLESQYVN